MKKINKNIQHFFFFLKIVFSILLFLPNTLFAIKITETCISEEVIKIFQQYGVGKGRDVCGRVDPKTSRIVGDELCEQYINQEKLKYNLNTVYCEKIEKIRIEGMDQYVPLKNTNAVVCPFFGGPKIAIINGPARTYYYIGEMDSAKKRNKAIISTSEMDSTKKRNKAISTSDVKRPKIENRSSKPSGIRIQENKNQLSQNQPVTALMWLHRITKIELSVDPEDIKIEETNDAKKADNMFRMFGDLKLFVKKGLVNKRNSDHICSFAPEIRKQICQNALEKLTVQMIRYNFSPENPNECKDMEISKYRIFNNEPKCTKHTMMECWYVGGAGAKSFVAIVNTTVKGLYYVAQISNDHSYKITHCLKL